MDETISGERVEQRLSECHKSQGNVHLMTGTSQGGVMSKNIVAPKPLT